MLFSVFRFTSVRAFSFFFFNLFFITMSPLVMEGKIDLTQGNHLEGVEKIINLVLQAQNLKLSILYTVN